MLLTYTIYLSVLFSSTFLLYLADKFRNLWLRNLLISFSFFVVFFVAAIRYNVGSDYPGYAEYYYLFQNDGGHFVEPGYRLINILFSELGLGFKYFVGFISFITYFIFYKSYPNKKSYIFHFVFMCTLYLYSLSNIRSSIVYGLMFIAIIKYMNDKKLLPYLLFTAVSSLFHISSLIYLIVPIAFSWPIVRLIKTRLIPELILLILLALALKPDIFATILFSNPLTEFLGFSHYASAEKWGGGGDVSSGLGVIVALSVPSIFILFRKHMIYRDNKICYVVILCFIYVFLYDFAIAVKIASRLKLLFATTNILVFYYLMVHLKKTNKILIMLPITLYFLMVFIRTIQVSNVEKFTDDTGIKVSPYVTIFNRQDSARSDVYID